ncbi:hypothetical protein NA56DRAFT_699778 [Hyaloscypha hepaticicola]|uniref:Uncharacterized protein n=1 Tax=Hyaloscypha hepaticicola TaxID=2082293 RepID=A0A2J6QFE1_9HELO|nr:hypothetical protein NA56DRAFT_699778 [Hyaloscypha hepaticicola]
MSKNSFSKRTVLCIKFLFAGAKQVQSSPDIIVSAFCSFIGDEQARPLSLDSTGVYPLWASFLLFILGDRRGAIWEAVSLTLQSSLCRKVLNSKFGPRNCQKWVIRGPEQGTITTGNVRFAILEVVE